MLADQKSKAPPGRTDNEAGKAIERRVIAVHEAGHAVAHLALVLGKIKAITLFVSREDGFVSYSGQTTVLTDHRRSFSRTNCSQDAIAAAIVCMAGPAAEQRYCVENGIHDNSASASLADRENALRAIGNAFDVDRDTILDHVVLGARDLVQRPELWRAIVAVADSLKNIWPEERCNDDDISRHLEGDIVEKIAVTIGRFEYGASRYQGGLA